MAAALKTEKSPMSMLKL